jgi:hypothetical protein
MYTMSGIAKSASGTDAVYVELSPRRSQKDRDDEELQQLGKKPVLKV